MGGMTGFVSLWSIVEFLSLRVWITIVITNQYMKWLWVIQEDKKSKQSKQDQTRNNYENSISKTYRYMLESIN